MSTATVSGEVHGGYEQILASYEADIARLEELHGQHEGRIARLQALSRQLQEADGAYEQRMAGLRALNADEATIGDVAALRETNELQISATSEEIEKAAAAQEANTQQLAAAREARDNWVSRQGAVKETRDATGARGDNALYSQPTGWGGAPAGPGSPPGSPASTSQSTSQRHDRQGDQGEAMTVKARDEFRIFGSRFTRKGRLIEHVDLRYLTGVTVFEADRICDEMRRDLETPCFLVHMEQLYDHVTPDP